MFNTRNGRGPRPLPWGSVKLPRPIVRARPRCAPTRSRGAGRRRTPSADRREDPHRPGLTVLTQTLSAYTPTPRPHIEVFPIVRPTRLLLCSDGLTDPLDLDRIRAKLEGRIGEPGSAEYAAALLVQPAIDEGGPDNISVIVVDIVPSGDRTPSLAVEANSERRADN